MGVSTAIDKTVVGRLDGVAARGVRSAEAVGKDAAEATGSSIGFDSVNLAGAGRTIAQGARSAADLASLAGEDAVLATRLAGRGAKSAGGYWVGRLIGSVRGLFGHGTADQLVARAQALNGKPARSALEQGVQEGLTNRYLLTAGKAAGKDVAKVQEVFNAARDLGGGELVGGGTLDDKIAANSGFDWYKLARPLPGSRP